VRGERTHYRAFTVNPCNELEVAGAAEDNGKRPAVLHLGRHGEHLGLG